MDVMPEHKPDGSRAPLATVVVPCFNGGRFLPGLVASLETQTFRDFEVVLVDDGSTETATIAAIAALPPAYRVIRQANQGLAAARNSGFAAARSPLVLPLDCDDRLAPMCLERMLGRLEEAGARTFVFCDMQTVGELDIVLPRRFNRFDQLIVNGLPYCCLLRRSAWEEAGGYDTQMRDGYEDWELNIRLIGRGFRGVRLPEPLFIYRVDASGMLMSRSAHQHGRLWREIRARHPDRYALRALIASWREARRCDEPSRFGVVIGLIMVALARALPDAVVNRLFMAGLRYAHTAHGWRP